jgi:hypothetical protein
MKDLNEIMEISDLDRSEPELVYKYWAACLGNHSFRDILAYTLVIIRMSFGGD